MAKTSPAFYLLTIALLFNGSQTRNIVEEVLDGFEAPLKNIDKENSNRCQCSDTFCECCSAVGSSKVCNEVKLVNISGVREELGMELSINVNKVPIFSENISLKELEPICYPYGRFNFCLQVELMKNKQEKGKVCGTFLANVNGEHSKGDGKRQIFCLQFVSDYLHQGVQYHAATPDFTHRPVKNLSPR